MLYSFDSMSRMKKVPHEQEYQTWMGRLTPDEIFAIRQEIESRIKGREIHVSSWIPGSDWSGSPFMPIYMKACQQNEEQAAMCFGLILWELLLKREEWWGFGRYEIDGKPLKGLTYFRIAMPASL